MVNQNRALASSIDADGLKASVPAKTRRLRGFVKLVFPGYSCISFPLWRQQSRPWFCRVVQRFVSGLELKSGKIPTAQASMPPMQQLGAAMPMLGR